jgi:hypothetical protein
VWLVGVRVCVGGGCGSGCGGGLGGGAMVVCWPQQLHHHDRPCVVSCVWSDLRLGYVCLVHSAGAWGLVMGGGGESGVERRILPPVSIDQIDPRLPT